MSERPERTLNVGDKIRVNMHGVRIDNATVRAVVPNTDGLRLRVDVGHNQTALIQVIED